MEVYREHRSIDRPPAAVASAVFDEADVRRYGSRRLGLYRTETVLDAAEGSLRTTVTVPGVTLLTALAVAIAAVGVVAPPVRLLGLWTCALAVVLPLGHLLPRVDARPEAGRVTERHVTPATVPAYVAAVGSLWLTLAPTIGHPATWFGGALFVVGLACYAVAAGWRTASVSTLWLPAAGLLPLLSTIGALAVVLALATRGGGAVAVGAGVAFTGVAVGVLAGYCYLVCRSVRAARFEPLASSGKRRGLFAGYLAVLLVLLWVLGHLAGSVAARFGPLVVAVLAAPLILPAGGWLAHRLRSGRVRLAAVRGAASRTVDGIPLYVLDVERPVVRAASAPRGVVVSRPVVETLPEDELAAVVAHERHHLQGQSVIVRVAVGVVSVVVGHNPVAAFLDHPARERSADRYAVACAGSRPLVRALRRLERLDGRTPARRSTPRLVAAPHALLFGAVADAAMYPSIDDRIAAVADAA